MERRQRQKVSSLLEPGRAPCGLNRLAFRPSGKASKQDKVTHTASRTKQRQSSCDFEQQHTGSNSRLEQFVCKSTVAGLNVSQHTVHVMICLLSGLQHVPPVWAATHVICLCVSFVRAASPMFAHNLLPESNPTLLYCNRCFSQRSLKAKSCERHPHMLCRWLGLFLLRKLTLSSYTNA